MAKFDLPVVLLIGAESKKRPIKGVFKEINRLERLFYANENNEPLFELQSLPSFTTEMLADKLDELTNRLCVWHFAGHSNEKCLITDDESDSESAVYSHRIASHIDSWEQPPSLIFLNGCKNEAQVKDFHAAGVAVVIATNQIISDSEAENFACEFYKQLFGDPLKTSLDEAFDRATPRLLLNDDGKFRSPDVESLLSSEVNTFDWCIFPKYEKQLNWTIKNLITNDRPIRDKDRQLVNPYKGLAAFQEEDQQWFFGRDKLIKELVDGIPSTNFYSLLGASGSGKSSLISAGVLPRLREMGDYTLLQCHPGNSPFKELVEVLAGFLPSEEASPQGKEQLASSLRAEERSIAELLEPANKSRHVFLIIDQFEELFTQSDKVTIQAFLNQITSLLLLTSTEHPCFTLILIMRADFLASALSHPEFARSMDSSPHRLLSPMSEVELQDAIEKPAQKQHVSIEGSLIRALLTALEDQTGSLPLLQHVLSLLWDERKNQVIRLEDYQALGGLEQALESQANAIYNALSDGEKVACKQVFGRLVQLDETRENATTRRRAYFDEFPNESQREAITKLADARLVTTYGKSEEAGAYIEISHESLIQHWSLLQEWIRENQDEWRLQSKIAAAFKEWKTEGHHEDWLLEGTRLSNAKDWLTRNRTEALVAVVIGENEIAYIEAGIEQEERALQEEEARRQREMQLEEDKRKLAEQRVAEREKSLKEIKKINTELNSSITKLHIEKVESIVSDDVLSGEIERNMIDIRKAWLYGLNAINENLLPRKYRELDLVCARLSALREQDLSTEINQTTFVVLGGIKSIIYKPNGACFFSASENVVDVWSTSSGEHLKRLVIHKKDVTSLAYIPTKSILIFGSLDENIYFCDPETGEIIISLLGHTGGVLTVVVSPDDRTLVSGASDGGIYLWDTETGPLCQNCCHP